MLIFNFLPELSAKHERAELSARAERGNDWAYAAEQALLFFTQI